MRPWCFGHEEVGTAGAARARQDRFFGKIFARASEANGSADRNVQAETGDLLMSGCFAAAYQKKLSC